MITLERVMKNRVYQKNYAEKYNLFSILLTIHLTNSLNLNKMFK